MQDKQMMFQPGYKPGEYADYLTKLLQGCEMSVRPELGRVWCRTACQTGMHPALVEAIHSLARIAIMVE